MEAMSRYKDVDRAGVVALRRMLLDLPHPDEAPRVPVTEADGEFNTRLLKATAAAKRLAELEEKAAGLKDPAGPWTVERARAHLHSWAKNVRQYHEEKARAKEALEVSKNNPRVEAKLKELKEPSFLPESVKLKSQYQDFLSKVSNLSATGGPYQAVATNFLSDLAAMRREVQARGLDLDDHVARYRAMNPEDVYEAPHPGSLTRYFESGSPQALPGVEGVRGAESFVGWLEWVVTDEQRRTALAENWKNVVAEAKYREWVTEDGRLSHTGEPLKPPASLSATMGQALAK